MPLDSKADDGLVRPPLQLVYGVVALLVGLVVAVVAVRGEGQESAAIGYALIVVGVVLVLNAALVHKRGRAGVEGALGEGRASGLAVLAVALAVVVPPAGMLLGAAVPRGHGRSSELAGVAVVVGAVWGVLLVLLVLLALALHAVPGG
jgi:hypothetical protein